VNLECIHTNREQAKHGPGQVRHSQNKYLDLKFSENAAFFLKADYN